MFTAGGLNITARTPFGSPCASIEAAKEEIRALLLQPPSSVTDFERFRLDYLVKYLEATHVPIHTGQFLSLALGGTWTLKYSNVILSRPDASLTHQISQLITPAANHSHGTLINRISWNLDRPNDVGSGVLEVHCSYTVSSKGGLALSLQDHVLNIEQLPQDAEEVVMTMQRTIPFQLFDPDGATTSTTYVDPWMRISRVTGPIFRELFEVYFRESERERERGE